jgi:cytochrome c553
MKSSHFLIPAFVGCLALLSCSVAAVTSDLAAARDIEAALYLKPNVENGKTAYLKCVGCHQPEGWGETDGSYPQIAGQLYTVIIKQMADIRARNRDTPIMLPFTMLENLSVQEIADVSAYISGLPMSPLCNAGPGTDLERGKKLYRERCAECHGDAGQGDAKKMAPLIQGQHYQYLKRQFDWIRSGKRRNGDPQMVQRVEDLEAAEVSAVLDYVSRLRPPEEKIAKPGWRNPDYPQLTRKVTDYPTDVCKINN